MLGNGQYARRGKAAPDYVHQRQCKRAWWCLQQGYARAVIHFYAPSMQLPSHPHRQFAIWRNQGDALSGNLQRAPDAHGDCLGFLRAIFRLQPFCMRKAFAQRRQVLPIYAMFRQAEYLGNRRGIWLGSSGRKDVNLAAVDAHKFQQMLQMKLRMDLHITTPPKAWAIVGGRR